MPAIKYVPIEDEAGRESLLPRREPYWMMIAPGRHIGFRRTRFGGHWILRHYRGPNPDGGKGWTKLRSLGPIGNLRGRPAIHRVIAEARRWFDSIDNGTPYTCRLDDEPLGEPPAPPTRDVDPFGVFPGRRALRARFKHPPAREAA